MPPETLPKDIALPELDAADQGASLWSDAWRVACVFGRYGREILFGPR